MELALSPQGRLSLSSAKDSPQALGDFSQTLRENHERILLYLAQKPALKGRGLSFRYWCHIADEFMRALCAHADADPVQVPASPHQLQQFVEACPPIPGSEYISAEKLQMIWRTAEAAIQQEISSQPLTPRQYIAKAFPLWGDAGKVFFHLAENSGDERRPFAFLATYTIRVHGRARVQHQPLGIALKISMERQESSLLQRMIKPIEKAAAASPFLKAQLDSKAIYGKALFTPAEAFQFINEIPCYEQAGIVCRLPKTWQGGRPARAKVNVQLGTAKKGGLGLQSLIDFKVNIAVNHETLTAKDWEELLNAQGPLVQWRGQWVEVNGSKLQVLLATWKDVWKLARGRGLSFGEAMRLLTGFQNAPPGGATLETDDSSWLAVSAGASFSRLLNQLKAKATLPEAILDSHLQAELRPYQKEGVGWLRTLHNLGLGGCLADDMGLGKTIQIISLFLLLKHETSGKKAPNLLVVPASLIGNWQNEMSRFSPGLSVHILHASQAGGLNAERNAILKCDVVITTYGMLQRLPWLAGIDWHTIIADEAQQVKNSQTQQAKALKALKAHTRFALTGTPVENSLNDLWSLFDFTCPGLLGNQTAFKNAIATMESKKDVDYSPLRKLIAPYLLRRKKTDRALISDLPDKTEVDAFCYLSKRQAQLYQEEVNRLKEALDEDLEEPKRRGTVLASLTRFKQICNHPSQATGDNHYSPSLSGKFSKLKEIATTIAARQEKVLIFTQYRELTDILHHFLAELFFQPGLVLHGGTAVKKRQELVKQFQDESGPPFFILSLKAGGTGLNLTAASHVIHFDRWWNPAVENQATDRAFRIGQRRNVIVHKFICRGTVEERIDQLIKSKSKLAESVITSGGDLKFSKLSDEELLNLVQLDINNIQEGEDP